MEAKKTRVLTINAGSSSIKLNLFLAAYPDTVCEPTVNASITGIGLSRVMFTVHSPCEETQVKDLGSVNYANAIEYLMRWLTHTLPIQDLIAIGHRVVHGGPNHSHPELITDDLERELHTFEAFDPEHAPVALRLITALRERLPHITQVACFDTAFFHDLPRVAQQLPLPRRYETQGLRRYGFHGLSYTFLLAKFQQIAGSDAAQGRVILAHLGSGASLAALRHGQPLDTTMSFTPASGIPMSTRSGDLDPGIASYLHRQAGLSIEAYDHLINFESGLLGVSESSGDMYALLQKETTDIRAAEAVNLFVYQIKKSIGALSAVLGGLDSLIFSGGIGEASSPIRERVCQGLSYLGIDLDDTNNQSQQDLISTPHSRVGVHVIATNEAQVIAEQVIEALHIHQLERKHHDVSR